MINQAQLQSIQDPQVQQTVLTLANLLEQALTDNDTLRAEVQRLKDEINRLKGEQGKPDIKPSKKNGDANNDNDHSSELTFKLFSSRG